LRHQARRPSPGLPLGLRYNGFQVHNSASNGIEERPRPINRPRGTRNRRSSRRKRIGRRSHICFVAKQFAPPVLDGSGLVYKVWLDTLSRRHDVYAVLFKQYPVDTREANDDLP
jgi:hypothetical protein